MLRNSLLLLLCAAAVGVTTPFAQAAQKIVSFSICGGSDCKNNASQHNFTEPGAIKVPTGLPSGINLKRINYSCAAYCSHAALWPEIIVEKGSDASYVLFNAHHNGSVSATSTARRTVYTVNIWLHY